MKNTLRNTILTGLTALTLSSTPAKAILYDDFSSGFLDSDKWSEVSNMSEHFVNNFGLFYHTGQTTPSDRENLLMLNRTFNSEEFLNYSINYSSGSGNRIHVISIDNSSSKFYGLFGFWNGIEPAGNDFGTYNMRIDFTDLGTDLTITKPDNSVATRFFSSPGSTHTIGIGTRTGHNGLVNMDYDNFYINGITENVDVPDSGSTLSLGLLGLGALFATRRKK